MRKTDAVRIEKEKRKLIDNQFEARTKLDNALELLEAATENSGFSCVRNAKERELDYLLGYGNLNKMLYVIGRFIRDAKDCLEVYF